MPPSSETAKSGARPALQARSRETRDKLVLALEELLREKSFDQIAVTEIADRAGVSAASIYRRFKNKEALLPVLFDLYLVRLQEWMRSPDAQIEIDENTPLRTAIHRIMQAAWKQCGQQAHIIRTIYLYVRLRPNLIENDVAQYREASRAGLRALLDAYSDDVRRPDLDRAADMLFYFLQTIFLEKGLFAEEVPAIDMPLEGEAFASAVAEMAYGYLVADPSSAPEP